SASPCWPMRPRLARARTTPGPGIARSSCARMSSSMSTEINRRQLLRRAGGGFASLALAALLADESPIEAAGEPGRDPGQEPLALRAPHFAARAKRVIFLFMPGG